jgi:sn-glycerol 3-phosphate transport system permease protein
LSQLITSVLAAYAFVFMKMWGRTVLFGLFLATLLVP